MSELKTIIDANIKENGNQEITGKVLNYVLNKIAEGTQKDWNESDATNEEYIKGRTHGVTYEHVSVEGTLKELGYVPGEYVSVLHYARDNGVLEGKGLYLGGLLYNPIVGEEYRAKYEGPSVYARVVEVEDGYDVQIKGSSDTGNLLKVAIVEYKKIDDAYISTDIARKSQVDALEDKVDNLPQGDKFDKQGNYPLLHVGTADDLAGRGESVPAEFGFRASGGKSIKDGRAYIKRIKGNSVVWNQTMEKPYTTFITNRVTYSIENNVVRCVVNSIAYPFVGIFSDKVEKQHTYLVAFKYLGNKNAYVEGGVAIQGQGINIAANKLTQFTAIKKASQTASVGFVMATTIESMEIGDTFEIHDINVYDLTKMFGSGNEPTTIEEYNARKPKVADEYAYNEGEVIHMNTESIKSVGDNAWDEEWELGSGNSSTGNISNGISVVSKNYIPIVGGEKYYISSPTHAYLYFYDSEKKHIAIGSFVKQNTEFSVPTNARYMRFQIDGTYGSIYNHDIMITLVHSGWKQDTDAGYQPYWQDTLPLPIIRKYFRDGMKSAGSAHDEIRYNKASGKWEAVQRIWGIRVADYVRRDAEGVFILSNLPKKPVNNINGIYSTNVLMAGYTPDLGAFSYEVISEARIAIVEDSIWLNAENLKQYASTQEYIDAIGDTKVFYELAEPIVTEITEDFRDYYNVADFGTEQAIPATDAEGNIIPSAPFSADIIYQFNAVDMIREHEIEITELQKVIATMQAQLTSLTNGVE